ncbi:MAG: ABC transporter ATP-binding protein [Clostridiales bacterium]|nr:ABC transporter ATP-binding protein [Clostridiales bacterium]
MIRRFLRYYKPHWRLFAADMFCALIIALSDLFYPIITRKIINIYIPQKEIRLVVIFCSVLLLIYLLKMVLNYFVQYYGHLVGVRMQADMRRDVFKHLQGLPLKYFDNNKTGSIMSRITNDLMDVSELAHHGPEDLFLSVILLVGSFAIMASINLWLALIVFMALPLMIAFAAKMRTKMSAAFTQTRVEISEINANLENSISGIRVSKAYTNTDYEIEHFNESNSRFVLARKNAYRAMAEFSSVTGFISDFLNVVVLISGALFLISGQIDFGDFAAFILYVNVFLGPIKRLINFVEQYQNGMSGFKRFCEIMETEPEKDSEDAIDIVDVKGDIRFEKVSFSYDESRKVLEDISFEVKAGKTLALVGPSGGGKTTICNIIPRFYDIGSGGVYINNTNIKKIKIKSLREQIGIVAQDVFLFNDTIYANIAYGAPDAAPEAVYEAAKLANIHDYIQSLPDGYDTIVGERGVKLSGGQKQRISIARVFLKDPPILILDEATSALDNATEQMIQASLEQLCRGRTTIVVAHRLTTVRGADEIIVITDEGIAEQGSHEELLCKNGIYAELYHSQFKRSGEGISEQLS